MFFPRRILRIASPLLITLCLSGAVAWCEEEAPEPRGEIRVVESWRPDINVLGHNVLQYLFEYALDRNELAPSLAISREWIDDTTLEVKLRQGVNFTNGEPFDAHAVKFNFDYQREQLAEQSSSSRSPSQQVVQSKDRLGFAGQRKPQNNRLGGNIATRGMLLCLCRERMVHPRL